MLLLLTTWVLIPEPNDESGANVDASVGVAVSALNTLKSRLHKIPSLLSRV